MTTGAGARLRVVHIITDLDIGGAEMMLSRLVTALDPARFENVVVSLTSGGVLAQRIIDAGVRVIELEMHPGRPNGRELLRAFAVLRSLKPDIVQTWLYHADFVGLFAGRLARVPRIVWSVRCSELRDTEMSRGLRMILRVLALSSRWTSAVVYNSVSGQRVHERLGYRPPRSEVIPNGLDTDEYRPSSVARARVRQMIGVADDQPLVGLVARMHPMKDHETFLRAAALVTRERPAHFVLVGRGVSESKAVHELLAALELTHRVTLLPERQDVAQLTAGLDVAVSSSVSEGFSNVVLEAMSCGVPCVTTDAGDSALMVADPSRVVPIQNPAALARAIIRVLEMTKAERETLGLRDRARSLAHYSLQGVRERYQSMYERLAGRPNRVIPVGT